MFRAWYLPFYGYGVIHGDPHLGNYTVRDDLDLNLLDFGCIRIFPPRFVKGVIDLYWALARGDRDLAVAAYESWGFDEPRRMLPSTSSTNGRRFLYGPLMEDRPRLIEETNSSQQGREVAERVHQKLREVGGVTPPREFVFMDRAAIGLGAVFLHLKRRGELAPAVHGADRRFRRRPARAAPDHGADWQGPAAPNVRACASISTRSLPTDAAGITMFPFRRLFLVASHWDLPLRRSSGRRRHAPEAPAC